MSKVVKEKIREMPALTYACVQRHVSHEWNILFINGFHHVTINLSASIYGASIDASWKRWETPVQMLQSKKIDENLTVPK